MNTKLIPTWIAFIESLILGMLIRHYISIHDGLTLPFPYPSRMLTLVCFCLGFAYNFWRWPNRKISETDRRLWRRTFYLIVVALVIMVSAAIFAYIMDPERHYFWLMYLVVVYFTLITAGIFAILGIIRSFLLLTSIRALAFMFDWRKGGLRYALSHQHIALLQVGIGTLLLTSFWTYTNHTNGLASYVIGSIIMLMGVYFWRRAHIQPTHNEE